MFQKTVFVVDCCSFELILMPSAPLFQKTVFAVDSFSVELILLPSDPLFQNTNLGCGQLLFCTNLFTLCSSVSEAFRF